MMDLSVRTSLKKQQKKKAKAEFNGRDFDRDGLLTLDELGRFIGYGERYPSKQGFDEDSKLSFDKYMLLPIKYVNSGADWLFLKEIFVHFIR